MTRAELRKLLEEATPGPWVVEVSDELPDDALARLPRTDVMSEATTMGVCKLSRLHNDAADAALIAAAVNALGPLLDRLDAAEAALEQISSDCAAIRADDIAHDAREALAALRKETA